MPENATISDVYYEYTSIVLELGTTLPDQYKTALVIVYVGRSPQDYMIEHVLVTA